jgi:hypothetical protein
MMTCRDSERLWNDLLDSRADPGSEIERALERHAADCPSCRVIAARYQRLRQAILHPGKPPAPSARAVSRTIARLEDISLGSDTRGWRIWAVAGVAAAAVLAIILVGPGRERPRRVDAGRPGPRPLAASLADATSATLGLARAASAPAARVGREVLAVVPEAAPAPPLPIPDDPAGAIVRKVGDRVQAGVGPLSGSARHAFGFLIPAQAAPRDRPPSRPSPST